MIYRIIALLALITFFPQTDQRFDPSLFAALKWRNIGPNRGGRSIAATGSASRPLEYYFGATGGGLWKTDDGGVTWRPVTDGQIKSSSVGAVAVSDSNPDIVYVGMGETEFRGNVMQGDGVYKSVDGGKTWAHAGLTDSQAISRVRIHPKNADLVFVAALGHPYGPNDERGVFRTRDGGKTWQKVLFRNNRAGAIDLVLDPQNPDVIYASIWDAYRTPWSLSSGGPASGLFKSTNGGDTWSEITHSPGLPKGVLGKICIAVSGADSRRVYANVEAEDGGIFVSDDAGGTWSRVNEDRGLRQRAFYFSRTYADPKQRDTLYVLNVELYKSTDAGKTFRVMRAPHADHHDFWIAPNDSRRLIDTNDGGASVSTNGGDSWTAETYPTAQLYHVATTVDFPYHVCGAQQDNSTACVPKDAGETYRDPADPPGNWLYAVGGGESGYVAPHPKNPNLFFAGSQEALITRYDRSTGFTRDIQVYPRFYSGEPAKSIPERWQWTFPIVFSNQDPNVLYASSQHLWRTVNEGQSWERISPDLTRADPKTMEDSGGPITKDQNGPEIYATIFTIAPSRLEANTIWTGSDDGLVHLTRDAGKSWQMVTPSALPEFSRISLIEASPHKAGTAYLAAKRYQLDDRAPYIFRTDDYGRTWTRIVNGIAPQDYVHAVREDRKRAGLLYAGTEHGIYVSFNNGGLWQSLSLNLPDVQVSDLVVEENDLVIATHGRSFYVLDDIGPLRQLTPSVSTSAMYLFEPRDAVRPLDQAAIDYVLKTPAQKVSLEITDSNGVVVKTFADASNKAGLNRFMWDLRYPGATVFPGMVLRSARPDLGPMAVPGSYQARLTVDGVTQTRPFQIKRDPRLTVSDDDLREQFTLAIQIRDKTSKANETVILIRDLKKQIQDRIDKANDPQVRSTGEVVSRSLSEVEEEIYQVRNRSPRDTLNFPIRLNNRIAALLRVVETGDARPTDQSYVVFKELSADLDIQLGKLNDALSSEVTRFNRLLADRKLEPVRW